MINLQCWRLTHEIGLGIELDMGACTNPGGILISATLLCWTVALEIRWRRARETRWRRAR